jgi:four helix bundle protein
VENLEKTLVNIEIGRQLLKSGTSVGANYIESNESLGKKDFLMKIRTCKREAKESCYWLKLSRSSEKFNQEKYSLLQESTELMKIFGAIESKSK